MHPERRLRREPQFHKLLLLLPALALLPGPAAADPTIDLSWNACAPIVADIPAAGPGTYSLYASVTGQAEPHMAYQVWILLCDANERLPDAWSFNGSGCQGSGRVSVAFAPAPAQAQDCPAFKGANNSMDMTSFQSPHGESGFPSTLGQIVFVTSYPTGVHDPDPNRRYLLGRVDFDHSSSVSGEARPGECGGFENGVTFKIQRNTPKWLSTDWLEHEFLRGNDELTFAGGAGPGITVPVASTTWGQIKAQYRH